MKILIKKKADSYKKHLLSDYNIGMIFEYQDRLYVLLNKKPATDIDNKQSYQCLDIGTELYSWLPVEAEIFVPSSLNIEYSI